jgi:hypothetical protein
MGILWVDETLPIVFTAPPTESGWIIAVQRHGDNKKE